MTDNTIDQYDYKLVKIAEDCDNLCVAIDMNIDEETHRLGHFKCSLNGKYRDYIFFSFENRALYTPFMEHYFGTKGNIAGMVEDIAAAEGLQFNNITVCEIAFDLNKNILNSVRRMIRNIEAYDMVVNGKRVAYADRKIDGYCEIHGSTRTRLIYPPTLYISQKRDDGIKLKIYNKTKEMQEESRAKKEYVTEWDEIPENQTIYRVEVTLRNQDVVDYCRMMCISCEEALYRLMYDGDFRLNLWAWCCDRLLYFTDKATGEHISIIDTLDY